MYFSCYICGKDKPEAVQNVHHKVPQACGGKDTPENKVSLCVECHQGLHQVAYMFGNPAKQGMIKDTVRSLYDSIQGQRRFMQLAYDVAKARLIKQENPDAPDLDDVEEDIIFSLPHSMKKALMLVARDRKISVQNYLRYLVLGDIKRKFPALEVDTLANKKRGHGR